MAVATRRLRLDDAAADGFVRTSARERRARPVLHA
jgi:hypothetical protein